MPEYKLPDVGEGLTEAEIVSWKVKVGDVIAVNDVVVEIETAKSLVELPSPYAGTVTALLVPEGETVPVGTAIIMIGSEEDAAPAEEAPLVEERAQRASRNPPPLEIDLSNPAASGGVEGESLVGRNKADRGPTRRPRKVSSGAIAAHMQTQASFEPFESPMVEAPAEPGPAVPDHTVDQPADQPADQPVLARTPEQVRVLAKPPVRKLAKDLGVDLASLVGSGSGGTVTRTDVEEAAGSPGTSSGVAPTSTGAHDVRETREPVKGVRKAMAGAMVSSAFTIPHVTEWVTVDVTATMDLVERLRSRREFREVKVSPLLILARAVTLAVRRTPELNSFWDADAQEVVVKHYVNLGIAAATPRGLVVPNVKDADTLSLLDLAVALGELTDTARAGRTQPADMTGGTFTITNVGPFGIDGGTPIINPGEAAILCFGAVRKQPWVVTRDGVDAIEVRQVTTLAVSFDHRHIDGEKGSRFLADVAGILEDPATSLLF